MEKSELLVHLLENASNRADHTREGLSITATAGATRNCGAVQPWWRYERRKTANLIWESSREEVPTHVEVLCNREFPKVRAYLKRKEQR